jgi:outer membrane protein assembly factor BamB
MKTGKLNWQTHDVNAHDEPDAKEGRSNTPPKFYGRGSATMAEGKFIVQGETGVLALVEVNPEKFVEISRVNYPEAGYPSWVAPVLAHKRLYLNVAREVRDRLGRYAHEYHLLCLDLAKP